MPHALILAALLITGTIRDGSGTALPGVTVYEKGASETVVTDREGHFSLPVSALPATITAFLGGFDSATLVTDKNTIDIRLELAAVTDMVTVTARAPRSTDAASTYQMRPLEVLRTAGAEADVLRALQFLPGVVKIDDGAGLFVRGGDVSEVRVLLDGATIQHPFRYESPSGGQFGAIPPMLIEGLSFSTGGFSARYGNALSAILDLRGLGRPSSAQAIATAGLAGVAARGGVPIGESAGLRASGNVTSTRLLFGVNGAPHQFDRFPGGWDANVSAHYEKPSLGTLKIFGMVQHDSVGVDFQREGFDGFLHSRSDHAIGIANCKKLTGAWQILGSAGFDEYDRGTDIGVLDLTTSDRRFTTRFDATRAIGGAALRIGVDAERSDTRVAGVKSIRGGDYGGSAGSVSFDVDDADTRGGIYGELEKTYGRVTPTIGVRVDSDHLLGATTVDPRLNVAVALTRSQKLRLAWGIFHQVPNAAYFDRVSGSHSLDSMEARHWIAGYELGSPEGSLFARVEAYDKTYRHLPLQDASSGFTSKGYGFARGIDFFASKKWSSADVRVAYSLLTSRRRWTSFEQQQQFELPGGTWRPDFDIPQALSIAANAQFTPSIGGAITVTSAAGKPNTPIIGSTLDKYGVSPLYGALNSERFPRYQRTDAAITYRPHVTGKTMVLFFLAADNVFARRNVFDYAYSADYSKRTPVVSAAPRSFYVGVTAVR